MLPLQKTGDEVNLISFHRLLHFKDSQDAPHTLDKQLEPEV